MVTALGAFDAPGTTRLTGSRTHSRLRRTQLPHLGSVFSTHFLRLARQVKHPVRSCFVPLRLLTWGCSDISDGAWAMMLAKKTAVLHENGNEQRPAYCGAGLGE